MASAVPTVRPINSEDFYKTWKHALAEDFQKDGLAASSVPWVSELARIPVNSTGTGVATLSPDNAMVAAAVGHEICVYDVASATLLHTFRGHVGDIRELEFHPGGRLLASGLSGNVRDRETMVRVWNLDASEQNLGRLEDAAEEVTAAAAAILLRHWSPEELESAELQKHIHELIFTAQTTVDVHNGRAFVGELPHFGSRAFGHDGNSLLYLPNRTTVAVVDVNTLKERFRLSGHTNTIVWAETSPGDTVVATASWDKTIRIWSMDSGETLRVLEGATVQSWAGAFSPDGELIAAGAGDKIVRIWRVATGELIHNLGGFQRWVRSLAFSPDGLCLAAGGAGGTLRVFNVDSGDSEQHWQIDLGTAANRVGSSFLEISNVQYTPRGDLFFNSAEGRIFGYRASDNLKWEFFEQRGTVVTSVDGSKLVAVQGPNIIIFKID